MSSKVSDVEKQDPDELPMSDMVALETSQTKCIDEAKDSQENLEVIADNYVEDDFEPLPEKTNFVSVHISRIRNFSSNWMSNNSKLIKWTIALICLCVYTGFFIWSMVCKTRDKTLWVVNDNIRLLWLSILLYVFLLYRVIKAVCDWQNIHISKLLDKSSKQFLDKYTRIGFYVCCGLISILIGIYVIYTAATHDPYNLVSLSGITLLISISYIFSTAPHMINWKPVLLGILLQFIFALAILTTNAGYETFKFFGERVTEFLHHTKAGCIMVFGPNLSEHIFAFSVLPIIVFLSSVMAVFYYLGIIQFLVISIGTVMQKIMGTTCGESLNAAANIFLGMTEAPLLIKPLLGRMTNSELHAVMTGGFATIAGSVLGAYIGYGAPANHLISASVMSAPAALAISKIMCPETKKSKTTKDDVKTLPKCPYKNIVEATTAGASDSIPIVANIAVNLIAFVAILAFFNATLSWFGDRFCIERKLTFQLICSYVFWPISLTMGVYFDDCRKIAELMGIKTFLNEFIAYKELGTLISNRKLFDSLNQSTFTWSYQFDDILIKQFNGTEILLRGGFLWKNRSVVIGTYALCGFANFGSMGILLSSLSTMIPHRRPDLSRLIIRAMIAGNIACFLTACIAGLFYKEK